MTAFIVLILLSAPSVIGWTYNGTEGTQFELFESKVKIICCSQGPEEWPNMYPNCGGDQQSPIDIQTNLTVGLNVPYLNFSHYDTITLASMLENGHTGKSR